MNYIELKEWFNFIKERDEDLKDKIAKIIFQDNHNNLQEN